jgi:hypothetical protein
MGRNAQRRRAAKDAAKPGRTVRPETTAAMRQLEARVRAIETLEQLQLMFLQVAPAHRARLMQIIKPWVPDDVPCCQPAMNAEGAKGHPVTIADHGEYCPERLTALDALRKTVQ